MTALTAYISTIEQDINQICHPLFNATGINYFNFCAWKNDGTFTGLTSDNKYVAHYLKKKFSTLGQKVSTGVHLWQGLFDDEVIKFARNDFDHDHGVSLVYTKPEGIEWYSFAASSKNTSIVNFYMNNLDLLEQFILYFKDQASEVINRCHELSLPISELFETKALPVNDIGTEQLREEINPRKVILDSKNGPIRLSVTELFCLCHYAKGISAADIGAVISRTQKTVEYHLGNIKHKAGVSKKSELIALYHRNFKFI